MWSVEVDPHDIVGPEVDLRTLTSFGREDLDVRAVCEKDLAGKGTVSRVEWEALSPRGAVFLGELASVGFFGTEAQQLLA